jgi:hypothetical protein
MAEPLLKCSGGEFVALSFGFISFPFQRVFVALAYSVTALLTAL